ncbi:flippase [Natronomonas sp. EA1]|uniref:flippase n=1 Tax=Natronomonas sp. EA1 TaxID=3421655 RepID=UPI003EC02588
MTIRKSSLKLFSASVFTKGLAFVGLAFFARELGAEAIGVFFLFQALIELLSVPADFGFRDAVVKRLSEGGDSAGIISTSMLLKMVPLVVISTLVLAFGDGINSFLGAELAFHLIVALGLREIALLCLHVLQGERQVGKTAFPIISRQVVYVGLGSAFLLFGSGVLGLIYAFMLGLVALFVFSARQVSTPIGRPTLSHARSLFDYSRYSVVSSITGYFYNWMDIIVIGWFLTQYFVGVYEVAWRVSGVVMLFSSAIATSIFPEVSKWSAENVTARIEALLPRVLIPSLFFTIPAFFGTLILSKNILAVVFGSEYTAGWIVLSILMFEKVFQSVHIILGNSLQGIDQPKLAARAGLVALSSNGVLNLLLVPAYGIVGAAVATAVSFLINTTLHGYYLSRFVDLRLPYARIFSMVAAAGGMATCLWVIQSAYPVDGILQLILMILLGVVIYHSLVFLDSNLRHTIVNNLRQVVA